MRQALELALDWIKKQPEETPLSKYDVNSRYVVIREIEAALEQSEQEPVAWSITYHGSHCNNLLSNETLAEVELKRLNDEYGPAGRTIIPLYTTPPQRTWVGLTNDEINNLAAGCHLGNSVQDAIYKAVAKLKDKNT